MKTHSVKPFAPTFGSKRKKKGRKDRTIDRFSYVADGKVYNFEIKEKKGLVLNTPSVVKGKTEVNPPTMMKVSWSAEGPIVEIGDTLKLVATKTGFKEVKEAAKGRKGLFALASLIFRR